MELINLKTKQPERFDNLDDASLKIASGEYGVYGDDIFPVYDPEGKAAKIKGDDLQRAISEGWKLKPITMDDPITNEAEADHYDKLNAQAAVLGALRGISVLGVSDQFLTKMYGMSPDHIRKLRQYNSTISGVSEVAGAVLPIIASGGTGLVGRAAAKTLPALLNKAGAFATNKAATALGRVAGTTAAESGIAKYVTGLTAKGIGSAVEAAAYGAGEFVTEDALKAPDMQSQSIWAHAGEAALAGGLLGSLLPAGVDAFGVVRRKIPSLFDWAAKSTRIVSGLKPDIIEAYMLEPTKYEGQISAEDISQMLTGRFKHFDDLVSKGQIELDDAYTVLRDKERDFANYSKDLPVMVKEAKKRVDDALKIEREEVGKAPIPKELVKETETLIKGVEKRRNELSQESYEILKNYDNPDNYKLNVDDIIISIINAPKSDKYKLFYKDGAPAPVGDVQNRFYAFHNKLISDLERFKKYYSSELTFPEIKKFVQLIDQNLGETAFGKMGSMEKELLKDVRYSIRQKLGMVDGYNRKMEEVEQAVELLDQLNAKFIGPKPEKGNRIKKNLFQIVKDKAGTNDNLKLLKDADLIVNPEFKYTENLMDRLTGIKADREFAIGKGAYAKTIEEARIGQSPALNEIFTKYKNLLTDEEMLESVKGRRYPEELSKAIEEKLFGKVELKDDIAAQKWNIGLKEPVVAYDKTIRKQFEPYQDYFKTIPKVMTASHQSPEKIKALFNDVSKLSDTDFVQLIEQLRVQTAFDNAFVNGSRNVNLYSRIASAILSPMTGVGGVAGGVFGGPTGAAIGAMFGGIMDYFGPAITKKILRSMSKLKGNFTPKDFRQTIIDNIPESSRRYLDNSVKVLSRIEKDTNKTINIVDTSLSDYLTRPITATTVAGVKALTDDREFENVKQEVQAYIDQRDSINNTFYDDNQHLTDIAPKTMDSYFQTYNRAIDFLDSKLPRSNQADLFGDSKPNRIEMMKFADYLRYTKRPLELFEEMKKGNISQEGIETLKNVYPSIYNHLVEQMMDQLSDPEKAKKLPFEKRLQLKRVLGLDFYPQFDYRAFASLQMTNSVKKQQEDQEKEKMGKLTSRQGKRSQTDMGRIINKQA